MRDVETDPVLVSPAFLDRSAADLRRFSRTYILLTVLHSAFTSVLLWFTLVEGGLVLLPLTCLFIAATVASGVIARDIRREAAARIRDLEQYT